MDAHIYKAALYCNDCIEAVKDRLNGHDLRGDSDQWPQGPYNNGGGEADCPQHCADCGVHLENDLTDDGRAYVRKALTPYIAPDDGDERDWTGVIASRAKDDGATVRALWARYYGDSL